MSEDKTFCKSPSSAATTSTSAWVSSPALCSVQRAPKFLPFAVTKAFLGTRCLSASNRPWEFVDLCERANSEDTVPPNISFFLMVVGSLKGSVLGHCSTEITLNSTCMKMFIWKLWETCAVTFCWDKTSSDSPDTLRLHTMALVQNW